MKVCKFEGLLLADANQIRKVCDIVLSGSKRRAIVVARAPGKRYDRDTKVTDLLIALANAVISGYDGRSEFDAVAGRYLSIVEAICIWMRPLPTRLRRYPPPHGSA